MYRRKLVVIIIGIFLNYKGYSQKVYEIHSFKKCLINVNGEKTNCQNLIGSILLSDVKIIPNSSIQYHEINNRTSMLIKWSSFTLVRFKEKNDANYSLILKTILNKNGNKGSLIFVLDSENNLSSISYQVKNAKQVTEYTLFPTLK